ncbi:MAG: hypothetical protein A3J38_10305 [Gammaproteobacteria bacterium RIFCSPHIGHO2_12_FULL_45_9]|nr:MAG: hypothetical protein A3J38_10305 [Gammaproteobacteria bacterium RIFCSPHIGHO2_12_FULL_45_9]
MKHSAQFLLVIGTLLTHTCLAETTYFLCGPDEDGCFDEPDYYRFCACIPQDPISFAEPYCLSWDKMACVPMNKTDCKNGVSFNTQSACVATLFQSEPTPPCPIKSEHFCKEHAVPICNAEGQTYSCKPAAP